MFFQCFLCKHILYSLSVWMVLSITVWFTELKTDLDSPSPTMLTLLLKVSLSITHRLPWKNTMKLWKPPSRIQYLLQRGTHTSAPSVKTIIAKCTFHIQHFFFILLFSIKKKNRNLHVFVWKIWYRSVIQESEHLPKMTILPWFVFFSGYLVINLLSTGYFM